MFDAHLHLDQLNDDNAFVDLRATLQSSSSRATTGENVGTEVFLTDEEFADARQQHSGGGGSSSSLSRKRGRTLSAADLQAMKVSLTATLNEQHRHYLEILKDTLLEAEEELEEEAEEEEKEKENNNKEKGGGKSNNNNNKKKKTSGEYSLSSFRQVALFCVGKGTVSSAEDCRGVLQRWKLHRQCPSKVVGGRVVADEETLPDLLPSLSAHSAPCVSSAIVFSTVLTHQVPSYAAMTASPPPPRPTASTRRNRRQWSTSPFSTHTAPPTVPPEEMALALWMDKALQDAPYPVLPRLLLSDRLAPLPSVLGPSTYHLCAVCMKRAEYRCWRCRRALFCSIQCHVAHDATRCLKYTV